MNQEKNKGAEYDFYGKLPLQKAILLGLQHVFAMFVGNLTPVLIITGACGIASGTEFADVQIALLQNAMLIAGIVTLIQLYAIGPIGGKVPIIMGTSSGFIGVCSSVASVMGGGILGYGAIMGASIIGGLFESVFGFMLKPLRRFFPAVVTGTVVLSIGLSLIGVGVNSFGGGNSANDFGSIENLLLGTIVLVIIIALKHGTKGITSASSVLIGIIAGYIIAGIMGVVLPTTAVNADGVEYTKAWVLNWDKVAQAGWFAIPKFMPVKIIFDARAKEINPNPSRREMDMLLTTGEQTSVSLMAMAMDFLGVPAVSLNAFQVAMHTTSVYSNARIKRIDTDRIMNELEQRKIVIVTGFQGVDQFDNYTTLGRGGSDTTAVALAAALHADACEIYTDVDGVYTADPRKVSEAKKLNEITYDEMLEMATLGAGVLHNRSVELAKKHGVALVVRSSLTTEEGTVVKESVKSRDNEISGVAGDDDAARIAVMGIEDTPGMAFKIFNVLAKKNVNVDMILQSVGHNDKKDISFTVKEEELDIAVKALEDYLPDSYYEEIKASKEVAKVSISGKGLLNHYGMAARMFNALYKADVNIRMISTSEIRVTVLVNQEDMVKAMNAAHEEFEM